MKERDVVRSFDGRKTATISWYGVDPDGIVRVVDKGYEFGYLLTGVQSSRTSTKLEFERDDRPEARARANWAVGYYRIHEVVGKPQPLVSLPPHLGPRIEPFEAARESYSQALLKDKWSFRYERPLPSLPSLCRPGGSSGMS